MISPQFHNFDAGVPFVISGQLYTFRGTLTLVPVDNLASHYLGGYKSLSSALRKCRQCMAVAEDMQSKVIMDIFRLTFTFFTVFIGGIYTKIPTNPCYSMCIFGGTPTRSFCHYIWNYS